MRRIRSAIVVAVLATTSGCSVYEDLRTSDFAKQDAGQIVEAASKAMQDVQRVRMTGQTWVRGTSYFIDLRLSRRGDCMGTLRVEGRNVDIRRLGDRVWFKGDSAFFRLAAGNVDVSKDELDALSRKWVRLTDDGAQELCDLDTLLKEFTVVDHGTDAPKKSEEKGKTSDVDISDVTVGEESDVGGTRAVRLTASPGGAHDEHVWVASEAPHHVVKLESTEIGDGGMLALSEYDVQFEVFAPSGKDVHRD